MNAIDKAREHLALCEQDGRRPAISDMGSLLDAIEAECAEAGGTRRDTGIRVIVDVEGLDALYGEVRALEAKLNEAYEVIDRIRGIEVTALVRPSRR